MTEFILYTTHKIIYLEPLLEHPSTIIKAFFLYLKTIILVTSFQIIKDTSIRTLITPNKTDFFF